MTTFPYRFRATEGLYAGTTFVYPEPGITVTYNTAAPWTYWRSHAALPGDGIAVSAAYAMDGDSYRRFEAIPIGDGT